jgi:hypothetical protein
MFRLLSALHDALTEHPESRTKPIRVNTFTARIVFVYQQRGRIATERKEHRLQMGCKSGAPIWMACRRFLDCDHRDLSARRSITSRRRLARR